MQVAGLLEQIRRCAMPEGAIESMATWLQQEGEIRFAPNHPWLPFRAEQWFPGGDIEFRWLARVYMTSFIHARVEDSFKRGRGKLTARVLGFIPVVRSRGPGTDKAEAIRALAELPWRPSAFRDSPSLKWEITETGRLRGDFNDGRTQATVEFQVDGEGHVLGGVAANRPLRAGKSMVETAWSGTFREYRKFDQIRVPTVAEATWHMPEGPFTYWRGRVTDYQILK